jgi:hypothetical protein
VAQLSLAAAAGLIAAVSLTACAHARPMALDVVMKGSGETLVLSFPFVDRGTCERARADRLQWAHAGLDYYRPAGWRKDDLLDGIREISPDGDVITTTYSCRERRLQAGELA